MRIYKSSKSWIGITSIGVGIIIGMVICYPLFLPRTISHENAVWINEISYIFYVLFVASIVFTAFNARKIFQMYKPQLNTWCGQSSSSSSSSTSSSSSSTSSSSPSSSSSYSLAKSLLFLVFSICEIIISILKDARYSRLFWPASIGYGIFYALVSSMIVFRFDSSISALYGVTVPSIIMISYGPVGYVPTMAAYLTEHFGLLIIPVNLIVSLVISTLVGFNTVLSAYAFAERPKKMVNNTGSGTGSILSVLGATTGLFAVCPTCASFYIFNVMAGSLAPTIAAFAVSYYALFLVLSIPLLLTTLIITALSIRRMMLIGRCYLK